MTYSTNCLACSYVSKTTSYSVISSEISVLDLTWTYNACFTHRPTPFAMRMRFVLFPHPWQRIRVAFLNGDVQKASGALEAVFSKGGHWGVLGGWGFWLRRVFTKDVSWILQKKMVWHVLTPYLYWMHQSTVSISICPVSVGVRHAQFNQKYAASIYCLRVFSDRISDYNRL